MRWCLAFLSLLPASCCGSVDQLWLDKAENNIDADTVRWLREGLKEDLVNMRSTDITQSIALDKKCFRNDGDNLSEPKLLVFMSFSVPDSTWMSLSKDIADVGGVFVLRGLPNNSFVSFAEKLVALKKKGLEAQVQLNPILFEEYGVKKVPAFVVQHESRYDKVSGNISVSCALNLIEKQGEARKAKSLLEKLRKQQPGNNT